MSAVVLCVFKDFILNWGMMTFKGNVLVAVSFLSHEIVTLQCRNCVRMAKKRESEIKKLYDTTKAELNFFLMLLNFIAIIAHPQVI